MRFESEQDLKRERKAIEAFVNVFGGSAKKLGPNDVDYKVFDKDNSLVAYAEVKGRLRVLSQAYPLPIAIRKLVKLCENVNPLKPNHNGICDAECRGVEGIGDIIQGVAHGGEKFYSEQIVKNK